MVKSKKKLLIMLISISLLMLAFSFASVPLYNIFCKATGYAGTIKRVQLFDDQKVGNRIIKVRFNSDISHNLNWQFAPYHREVSTKTGENALAFYTVQNLNNFESSGIAVYNVTPHKAAKYFNKIACFCFEKQTLKPMERIIMPVSFFIDSDIENDKEMNDIKTLTLSYTFFRYEDYKQSLG
jgi:cytochrome c oxidase assembly protein subunit 11